MAAMFPEALLAADENAIAYELFFTSSSTSDACLITVDEAQQKALVTRARDEMLAFAREFTCGFIWQRHQFHLAVHASSSAQSTTAATAANGRLLLGYYLRGETQVGDEIQDEWVVTALLMEITNRFPDVIVRVRDSDGEFLLIECADALPEWVHPENSDGRVLLRNGTLHLVSPSIVPEEEGDDEALRRRQSKKKKATKKSRADPFDDENAVRCMRAVLQQPLETKASDAMQRALSSKLSQVPPFMKENRHRVRCLLPANAARVLTQRPEVLGAAVEAFYYREPKFATSVCTKMEVFSPVEQSPPQQRMIAFSRCMFAQLKQQQFFAPKPFQKCPLYHDVLSSGAETTQSTDSEVLAAEIGMKLACGLEILYATGAEDQFGKSWRELIDTTLQSDDKPSDSSAIDVELLEENDDDSWLYVHPDSLEEKLRQVEASMGMAKKEATAGDLDEGAGGAEELENIATMFNNFLGGISGIDGVEGNESIQFDMSAFMEILNGAGLEGGDENSQRQPRFSDGGEYFYEDDDDDFGGDGSSDKNSDSDDEEDDARMEAAMAEMDAELSSTHMAKSFARFEHVSDLGSQLEGGDDEALDSDLDDEITADKPLDLDFNLLSNLLESFASQDGHAGPVSNILSELNFPRAG